MRTRRFLIAAACALLAGPASAGEPKATGQPLAVMTQEQLLEHQSKHAEHLFVLDVRTPAEYAQGHVPGAVNVPLDELGTRLAAVPRDKDVVIYCRTGRRSQLAADLLAANGYRRLAHLEGDIQGWLEKGRPVEKP